MGLSTRRHSAGSGMGGHVLQHLIGRRDRLRVHLVGALRDAVSTKRFSPRGSRPAGLMKSAVCTVPICAGAAWPGSATLTVPSVPIVTLCAFAGTVSAGSIG